MEGTLITVKPWEMTVIYRVTAQQVNFAENRRQLKILGSCLVTVIYRVTAIYTAVIYRFDRIIHFNCGGQK